MPRSLFLIEAYKSKKLIGIHDIGRIIVENTSRKIDWICLGLLGGM